MKIVNSPSNYYKNSPSFEKGLPAWFPAKACEKTPQEVEAIMKAKGVDATFNNIRAVAASCLATAEIFEAYNLTLPTKFTYEPLPERINAVYDKQEDTVIINSKQEYFEDIRYQDFLENMQTGTPVTKHFLHTYLHEFMHAAHFNNVNDIARFNQLNKFVPTKLLVEPINTFLKNISFFDFDSKIDKKYPRQMGTYSYTGLTDFVADRGAYILSKDLMEKTMVKEPDKNSKYSFISPQGDELFEFDREKNDTITEKIFEFFNGRQEVLKAIWNADIEMLKAPENKRFVIEV